MLPLYLHNLQAAKEVQIISQLPALVVEEIQPDTVTDSARLAPEEVKVKRIEFLNCCQAQTALEIIMFLYMTLASICNVQKCQFSDSIHRNMICHVIVRWMKLKGRREGQQTLMDYMYIVLFPVPLFTNHN